MRVVALAVCLVFLAVGAFAIPATELSALQSFYTLTNGTYWTHNTLWMNNTVSPCTWYGVTCSTGQANVIRISMSNNNLNGPLPGVIGNLLMLQSLTLSNNRLRGSISPLWGQLDSLFYLDISYNQLTDGLSTLSNMAALTTVYFNNNAFTGTLSFLPWLTKIQYFHAGSNQLTGFIPPAISMLYDLYGFRVDNNMLTGELPYGVGNLLLLNQFYVGGNRLTGMVPTFPVLAVADFSGNNWKCPLPAGAPYNATAVCTYCDPGSQLMGGVCNRCPRGTAGTGVGACIPCEGGMVAAEAGQAQCTMCPPHTISIGGAGCYDGLGAAAVAVIVVTMVLVIVVLFCQCCARRGDNLPAYRPTA